MSPHIEKLIEKMTASIVCEVDPKQMILFGSQAKRTARPNSDLEFLIVQDHSFGSGQTHRQQMGKIRRLLARFPVSQDILIYTPEGGGGKGLFFLPEGYPGGHLPVNLAPEIEALLIKAHHRRDRAVPTGEVKTNKS